MRTPTVSNHHSRFIQAEPFSGPGANAEELVWKVIKEAFRKRPAIGYSKYPLFTDVGQVRKEPDVLVADQKLGIVIVETKGIRISDIEGINGPLWHFKPGFYMRSGSPYKQAEKHLWAVLPKFDIERDLRRCVPGRALVALPYISRRQWEERGYHKLPSMPPILFKDDLTPKAALEGVRESSTVPGAHGALSDKQWMMLCTILGHTHIIKPPPVEDEHANGTLGSIIATARKQMAELDLQQQAIGKQIPPGPQRIRGVAGSGKTVLLAQKAAAMHLRHPSWDIALVFFTRSLYEHMTKLIDRWLRAFSDGKVTYDGEVRRRLRILHAWGARTQPGFYREVAQAAGQKPLGVRQAKAAGHDFAAGLNWCCKELLREKRVPQLFDAILIDEGQDLVSDDPELLYEGRQPFYWLAWSSLKPAAPYNEEKRLIWAYDEAQSLDSLRIPTASDLFGEDYARLVAGTHRGGIQKSEVMHRCYRTPGQILVAAHTLGMGLLRPDGAIASISTKWGWKAIGYDVEGDFRKADEQISLTRKDENSPNPIPGLSKSPVIKFREYKDRTSRNGEIPAVAKSIREAIRDGGLKPEELLVMPLARSRQGKDLLEYLAKELMNIGIEYYFASAPNKNLYAWSNDQTKPDRFRIPGCVTLSTLHRAKGNEADLVYLIGIDLIAELEDELAAPPLFGSKTDKKRTADERVDEIIRLRNGLFVGMTRSRGWLELSATGHFPLHDEIQQVLDLGTTVRFQNRPGRRSLAGD